MTSVYIPPPKIASCQKVWLCLILIGAEISRRKERALPLYENVFIARQDSDDISYKNRLMDQYNFLINSDFHEVNNQVLKDGFKIVGDFLNKTVLIPNNINYPVARNEFIKLI